MNNRQSQATMEGALLTSGMCEQKAWHIKGTMNPCKKCVFLKGLNDH